MVRFQGVHAYLAQLDQDNNKQPIFSREQPFIQDCNATFHIWKPWGLQGIPTVAFTELPNIIVRSNIAHFRMILSPKVIDALLGIWVTNLLYRPSDKDSKFILRFFLTFSKKSVF